MPQQSLPLKHSTLKAANRSESPSQTRRGTADIGTRLRVFSRSPKGILLLAFVPLLLVAGVGEGLTQVGSLVVVAALTAVVTDFLIMRYLRDTAGFPSGALLTGIIIAMVLESRVSIIVPITASVLAIASKYLFRTQWSNAFNPAALALVAVYFLFGAGESWWGAFANLSAVTMIILIPVGYFLADRVNKLPMVLAFLGAYFTLFTLSTAFGDPSTTAEIFRSPDINAVLFLAFFMLDDPPTSPVRYPDQITFGVIAAGVSYLVFTIFGGVYFLPVGILVANCYETIRRLDERSRKTATRA